MLLLLLWTEGYVCCASGNSMNDMNDAGRSVMRSYLHGSETLETWIHNKI